MLEDFPVSKYSLRKVRKKRVTPVSSEWRLRSEAFFSIARLLSLESLLEFSTPCTIRLALGCPVTAPLPLQPVLVKGSRKDPV